MLWQPGILPTYFLMFLSTIPAAPMRTSMTKSLLLLSLSLLLLLLLLYHNSLITHSDNAD